MSRRGAGGNLAIAFCQSSFSLKLRLTRRAHGAVGQILLIHLPGGGLFRPAETRHSPEGHAVIGPAGHMVLPFIL